MAISMFNLPSFSKHMQTCSRMTTLNPTRDRVIYNQWVIYLFISHLQEAPQTKWTRQHPVDAVWSVGSHMHNPGNWAGASYITYLSPCFTRHMQASLISALKLVSLFPIGIPHVMHFSTARQAMQKVSHHWLCYLKHRSIKSLSYFWVLSDTCKLRKHDSFSTIACTWCAWGMTIFFCLSSHG